MSVYNEDSNGFQIIDSLVDLSPPRKDEQPKNRQCCWKGCVTKLHIYKSDISNKVLEARLLEIFSKGVVLCYCHEKMTIDILSEIPMKEVTMEHIAKLRQLACHIVRPRHIKIIK